MHTVTPGTTVHPGLRRLAAIVMLSAAALCAGCGGRMTCHFASMNFKSITLDTENTDVARTDAKTVTLECTECFWWLDDEGLLNIAGRFQSRSLFSDALNRTFMISFVPGPPSRGVGREYTIGRNTVRGLIESGPMRYRVRGTFGIMAVDNAPGDVLVGAFKHRASISAAKFLGGWTAPVPYLIYGTFRATPDGHRGRAILEATEGDGFARKRPLAQATQPAGDI